MPYRIAKGRVVVKARSSVHDTVTTFPKVSGTIDLDPDRPRDARAEVSVDMRSFDAGDWFKNWKIKGDLDADTHPTARFALMRFDDLREPSPGQLEATAVGQLSWRGKTVDLKVRGKATVNRRTIEASASFDLNVRDLGMAPPRLFVFKVEDVVLVEVALNAVAT